MPTPLLFVLGGVALVVGAELLVRGASRLAAVAGLSPLVIGLTVVAFGTSAPEMAVTVGSAAAGEGGEIALSVAYQKGVPARSNRETKVYSNVDPDFYRIYRTTQYTDVLMSVPMGVDNVHSLAFDISIPSVRAILDGAEELVGIISLPWHMRKTILP